MMDISAVFRLMALATFATAIQSAAWAQSISGSEGSGELPRSIDVPDLSKRKIVDRSPKMEASEIGRDLSVMDEAALQRAFTTRSRSRDGREETVPPRDDLKSLIRGELQDGDDRESATPQTAEDPIFAETDRKVFAEDNRILIGQTTKFPFRVIGQLWSVTDKGEWSTCSATLIGRRAVITAAHCLYSHEDGGWLEDYEFYPGMNGEGNAPFGKYGWTNAHILQGFITNYQGYYGSVMPWDLAVLILDGNAGDALGWMGYAVYDPAYNFTGNIVGYPGDKRQSTMWRASCDIDASRADDFNFSYPCDTYPGSSGSAVYDYNPSAKDRHILGVNVAENQEANVGVRLGRANFAWVNGYARE